MKPQVLRIYIIRHGETEENKMGILQGQLNTQLNEMGVSQAEKVADALKDARFGIAFSSDLDRASKTAAVILKHHPGVTLYKQAALRERNMGELQGLKAGTQLEQPPSGIESLVDFSARAGGWWKDAVVRYAAVGTEQSRVPGDVLVLTHGGFIGVLVRELRDVHRPKLRATAAIEFGRCYNASVTVIELDRKSLEGKLVRYSDISHLTGPVVEDNADVEEM